jgi:hypothetical protein
MINYMHRFLNEFRFMEDKNTLNQHVNDRINSMNANYKQGIKLVIIGIISALPLSLCLFLFNYLYLETGVVRTILFLLILVFGVASISLLCGLYNISVVLINNVVDLIFKKTKQ